VAYIVLKGRRSARAARATVEVEAGKAGRVARNAGVMAGDVYK